MHNVNSGLKEREDKLTIGYDKTVAQTRTLESLKDFTESNNWLGAPSPPSAAQNTTPRKSEDGFRALDAGFRTIKNGASILLQ